MVMATRSGFGEAASLAGWVPAVGEYGDGNSVTWLVLASATLGEGEGGNAAGATGGSAGSSAGATAVARPADDALPPNMRFQSEGCGERFQIFAGDSSSTPTWKSSRGLAGGCTDFTKARMTGEMVSPSGWRTRRPTDEPTGYSCREG